MSTPSDLAIIVAQGQERLGSLSGKIEAFHARQDKMEKEIKETLKEMVVEMKSLREKVDTKLEVISTKVDNDFKDINSYIDKQKGQLTIVRVVTVILLPIIGGLVQKYLLK